MFTILAWLQSQFNCFLNYNNYNYPNNCFDICTYIYRLGSVLDLTVSKANNTDNMRENFSDSSSVVAAEATEKVSDITDCEASSLSRSSGVEYGDSSPEQDDDIFPSDDKDNNIVANKNEGKKLYDTLEAQLYVTVLIRYLRSSVVCYSTYTIP